MVLQYKGEVVHLLWHFQRCTVEAHSSDAAHTVVAGSMGSLVGRTVEPVRGRVDCSVLQILW